jgi:hypothetical protein
VLEAVGAVAGVDGAWGAADAEGVEEAAPPFEVVVDVEEADGGAEAVEESCAPS